MAAGRRVASIRLALCFALCLPASLAIAAPPQRLTLADAYKLAAQNSERLRIASAQVRDAELLRKEPWIDVGPEVTARGIYAAQTGNFGPEEGQALGELEARQPLFQHGFGAARRASGFNVLSARQFETRARQELMFESALQFISVLRARQQVQVAQGALTRADAQVLSAEARVKGGAALRTSVLLSSIDRRRAQLGLVDARRSLKLVEASFERVFQIPPPETLVLPTPPTPPPLQVALTRAATRADIRALENRVNQSSALLASLKGRILWPTFGLAAKVQYADPPFGGNAGGLRGPATTATEAQPLQYQALAVLELPLARGGGNMLAIRRQRIETEIAGLEARALRDRVNQEVRAAAARLDSAQQSGALALAQIKDARENYTLVEAQFKLGAATPLEVANAQAALTEAELLDLVAGYDQQLAVYEILLASGDLQL